MPQLKLIGVTWPPAKGWRKRVEGSEISEKDFARFLDLKNTHCKNAAVIKAKALHAELDSKLDHI